jgi:hypothetical protein
MASKVTANAAVRPDGAVLLPVASIAVGVVDEATRPPGEGEAGAGVKDWVGGAKERVAGVTLTSLRFNVLSKQQSLGTCLGSSQWQIRQIPFPPKACFHQVLIPLSPYDLHSQSKVNSKLYLHCRCVQMLQPEPGMRVYKTCLHDGAP